MTHQQRIKLDDTFISAATKLAEGNIGAVRVLLQLASTEAKIDPDAALPGIGVLLDLEQHGFYGSRIWMLYKDVCGQDITKMHAVLRAMQLGLVKKSAVENAIGTDETRGKPDAIDVWALLTAVKERLPRFASEVV